MRPLTLLVALALVAGCGTDEGDATFIRVTFDATMWSAEAGPAQIAYTVDNPDDSAMWVAVAARSRQGGQQLFSLGLPDPVATGTYALNGLGTYAAYISCPNDVLADCVSWTVVPSHPGTLTISDIDGATGLVRGTFAFNGYLLGDPTASAKSFTGGAFAIRVPGLMVPLTTPSPR